MKISKRLKEIVVAFCFTVVLKANAGDPAQVFAVAWGDDNGYGASTVPPNLGEIITATAGNYHNLAIRTNGTLAEWGTNMDSPPQGLSNVVAVSERWSHSLGLMSNGTVAAWGRNYYGALDVPSGLSNVVAIAAGGYQSIALQADGTVVGWGGQADSGTVPGSVGKAIAIAAGMNHSLAVRTNGTVAAWGDNSDGQCNVPVGLANVMAVAAGWRFSLAVKSDGTVVVWGGSDAGDPILSPPSGLTNVTAISAGGFHVLALKSDGTVAAWGDNAHHQCEVPTGLTNVVSISAGYGHSIAVSSAAAPLILTQPHSADARSGGSAQFTVTATGIGSLSYQWYKGGDAVGGATSDTLNLGNVPVSAAGDYTVAVSNSGGSVTSLAATLSVSPSALVNLNGPDVPPGLNGVVALDASTTHALALMGDGTVVGWKLKDTATAGAETPPVGLNNVTAIACGEAFSLALRADGTVTQWGFLSNRPKPAGLSNVVAIAAQEFKAAALKADGTVVSWGASYFPALTGIKAIAIAGLSLAGVKTNGDLYLWPDASTPDLGTFANLGNVEAISYWPGNLVALLETGEVAAPSAPPGISNVVAVSAGSFGVALHSNGTVSGWGEGVPETSGLTNVTVINARANYLVVQTLWPIITRQPKSATANVGEPAIFSVVAKGIGPFTYQWRKNGSNLDGETQTALSIAAPTESEAGDYTVVVAGPNGSIESRPATLQFLAPTVIAQSTAQTVFEGGKVVLWAQPSGTGPFQYQWRKGSTPLSGQTGSSFTIDSAQGTNAGTYSVVISNFKGTNESAAISLSVQAAPDWHWSVPGTVVSINGPSVPESLTNIVAVAAGTWHALALREDGTVVQFGKSPIVIGPPEPPEGLSNVVAIAAGEFDSMALKADGTVVGWGRDVPTNLFGVVGVSVGMLRGAVLKADGTIVSWGGPPTSPSAASPATAVDVGDLVGASLKPDGTVFAWGFASPPGGILPGISNVTAISVGQNQIVALKSDGSVIGGGVPDGLAGVQAIAAGKKSYGLALKSDGSVTGWGGAVIPDGLSGVTAIAAGGFGLAITTNPPLPSLAASLPETQQIVVGANVAAPGFRLQVSDNPAGPYDWAPSPLDRKTPINGEKRFYRLKKQ